MKRKDKEIKIVLTEEETKEFRKECRFLKAWLIIDICLVIIANVGAIFSDMIFKISYYSYLPFINVIFLTSAMITSYVLKKKLSKYKKESLK